MGLFKTAHIVNRADKISNFTVSTAEYGSAVMELLGTTRISGNVIYYDDFTAHEHRETQRSGKGGASRNNGGNFGGRGGNNRGGNFGGGRSNGNNRGGKGGNRPGRGGRR